MIDFNTLVLFISASLLLALAPGPDNIFVLTQSMLKGAKSGVFITLGLCSGLVFHTLAVALGVAAIFQTSLLAFNILKFIGAAYLLYLAYLSFKSSSKSSLQAEKNNLTLFQLYKRGIIMNVTNPKVSIFFLAFLPQFTNPQNGSITLQIFILGALFMLSALLVFSSIAFMSGKLGNWFKRSHNAENILNKIAGTIFAALALKLAFAQR
ncbi:MAG TPA: threonine transporter RhtB [Sulfurospirillum sp. UBA11407]|jgi:threonine/homoserine/homoserine lactone efflux protein|nr:MAG TPA: threonine transporter RhtB [Sulfurospirillum sp. UBA11407]DAB33275.1 MAG TPA: threonine transporter RhtB [Sulfurospirillum sp. UBA12182]